MRLRIAIRTGSATTGGGGAGSEHTLEEVGRSFSVTRERIRQIESKTLRKLRHPSRATRLKPFLDNTN